MFIVIVDERVSHQNFCGRRSKPINLNKYKAYIYDRLEIYFFRIYII